MTWLGRLYIWATYRLYDELAWAYDLVSWAVSLGRARGLRLAALDHVTGRRVLEIGFGTADLLAEMARRDLEPVGLDASPAMHRVAARKLARRGLEAPRVRAVTQGLPFPDGSFDAVVSTFPAGYIMHAATLREVARLLRPPDPVTGQGGGRFIVAGLVVEIAVPALQRAVQALLGWEDRAVVERFANLVQAAGFGVKVLEAQNGWLRAPLVVAERRPGGQAR